MKPRHLCFLPGLLFVLFHTQAAAQPLGFVPSSGPADDYPAGLPIPTAPDAPRGKNFAPVFAAWSKRIIVDTYQRLHPDDVTGLAFVRDAAALLQNGSEAVRAELNGRAAQPNMRGNGDPMVEFFFGLVTNNSHYREDCYRRATEGLMLRSDYSRFLLFMAAANLAKSLQDRKADAEDIAQADRTALAALRAGLNVESFHGDDSAALRWRLDAPSADSLFRRQPAPLVEIFANTNAIPEWVREFAQGRAYLAAAWMARTDGWASEVTEAGWEGWKRNLAEARRHFTRSWELNPRDPCAATYMIQVTMGDGGGKKEMRAWFDRAVAAEMDFFDAYRSFIWALRPRWSGSHEEMLLFGDELLRTARFDTCVPFYYFRVVADVASEESDPKAIYGRPEIAANLKLALDNYLATRDSPLSVSYAHTASAILEYKAGNLSAAKNHLALIQFKPDPNIDAGLKEDLSNLMRLVSGSATGMAKRAINSAPLRF